MREIFKLFGTITLQGLEGVNKQLSSVDKQAAKLERALSKFGKNVQSAGMSLSKGLTAPIAAIGTGMLALTTKTGEYAESLLNLEQSTGLSTERLQEYKHVADIVGVSYEGLTSKSKLLSARLQGMDKDGSNASKAMKSLGISSRNVNGNLKDMNDLFPEIITALQQETDVTERNRIAQNLFGKDLADIAPLLGMNADELKNMTDEAHRFGLVMDSGAIKSAAELDDKIGALKAQFKGFFVQLATNIIPIVKDTFIPIIENNVIPLVKAFAEKVKGLTEWFNKLSPAQKDAAVKMALFAAAIGPLLVVIGKGIVITRALSAAIITMNAALVVNPIVAVTTAIAGLTAGIWYAVNAYMGWRKQTQKNEAETARLNNITKEIQELASLKKEYEDIASRQQKLSDLKNPLFDPDTLAQARSNIETIKESIRQLNAEANGGSASALAAPSVPGIVPSGNRGGGGNDAQKAASDARLQIEKEYADKVNELTMNRLELNAKERDDAIANAEKIGADTINIKAYYALQEENIRAENLQKLTDEAAQASEIKIAEEKRVAEEEKRLEEEKRERIRAGADYAIKATEDVFGIFQGVTDNQIAALDNKTQREIANINASTLSEEQKKQKIEALQIDADKKKTDLMRKQAKQEKAAGIFGIIVNTAMAISKAYAQLGPILGTIAAVIMAGIGAAQIAIVASKPLPMKEGALIKGDRGGIVAQVGESKDDELILPMRKGAIEIAKEVVGQISNIVMPKLSTPQFAMAGANGNILSQRPINLNIGTLIADDHGLKELERRLYNFRNSEAQRKGAE